MLALIKPRLLAKYKLMLVRVKARMLAKIAPWTLPRSKLKMMARIDVS